MTFGELQTLVSVWLDDLAFGYFTRDQVRVWINNAQKETQKRLLKAGQNYYIRCVETTLVINQSEYVIPDDFRKEHRLEIILSGIPPNENKQPILPMTINQQDMVQAGPGLPRFYYLKQAKFVLFPAPDTPYIMRMLYSYMVSDMTLDNDVPDVPSQYHEYLAVLACQDGFLKDGRANELLEKKLMEYQAQLDSDAQERLLDQPRSIVQTGNDADSGYFF